MIAPFKRLTEAVVYRINPVLPQAYDDSLSYFEVLARLQKKVNELIKAVNDLMDAVEELDRRVGVLEVWRTNVVDPFIADFTEWRNETVDPFIQNITTWKNETVDPFIQNITTWKNETVDPFISSTTETLTLIDGRVTQLEQDISIATTSKAGIVKPDGTSITVEADGTIHATGIATIPNASSTVVGGIKTYWDASTSTLYITDTGDSPIPV